MIELAVEKIKNNQKLGKEVIDSIISSYCNEQITDEQILPLIKAIYDYDICDEDLFYLTDAMKNSGEVLDLSSLGTTIDKHSTGGVSDTTTLVLAPICACLGVKMFKMSGRALGFTGGTCDKLECFSGYKTDLEIEKAMQLVNENGACIVTSTKELAPADKKIYALRDKTGLVDNIPLIASSVMSKKLATNTNMILLDVKYGQGAFMPNKHMAKKLANKMIKIGELAGKEIDVVYGDMNEPLGDNIGPRLEAFEAIEVLKGKQGKLRRECIRLASKCVSMYKYIPLFVAKRLVKKVLDNGQALEKFKTMISIQGGSLDLFDEVLPKPSFVIKSNSSGRLKYLDTKRLGQIVADICHANGTEYSKENFVGVITKFKNNEKVKKNAVIFEVFSKNIENFNKIEQELLSCVEIK